jgi:aspartate carbamoyltransferase catalytic subunit
MNRGVEIDPEVADSDRSLVLQQVEAGVSARMAVLFQLLGADRDDAAAAGPRLGEEVPGRGAEHPDLAGARAAR